MFAGHMFSGLFRPRSPPSKSSPPLSDSAPLPALAPVQLQSPPPDSTTTTATTTASTPPHRYQYVVTPGMHGMKQWRTSKGKDGRFELVFSMENMSVDLIMVAALDCFNVSTRDIELTKYFEIKDSTFLTLQPKYPPDLTPKELHTQLMRDVAEEEREKFQPKSLFQPMIVPGDTNYTVERFRQSDRWCRYTYEPNDAMSNKRITTPDDFEKTIRVQPSFKNEEVDPEQTKKRKIEEDPEQTKKRNIEDNKLISHIGIFLANQTVQGLESGINLLFDEELIEFARGMGARDNGPAGKEGGPDPSSSAAGAAVAEGAGAAAGGGARAARQCPLHFLPTEEEIELSKRATREVNHISYFKDVPYISILTRKTLLHFLASKGISHVIFIDSTCDVFPSNTYDTIAKHVYMSGTSQKMQTLIETHTEALYKVRKLKNRLLKDHYNAKREDKWDVRLDFAFIKAHVDKFERSDDKTDAETWRDLYMDLVKLQARFEGEFQKLMRKNEEIEIGKMTEDDDDYTPHFSKEELKLKQELDIITKLKVHVWNTHFNNKQPNKWDDGLDDDFDDIKAKIDEIDELQLENPKTYLDLYEGIKAIEKWNEEEISKIFELTEAQHPHIAERERNRYGHYYEDPHPRRTGEYIRGGKRIKKTKKKRGRRRRLSKKPSFRKKSSKTKFHC